MPRVHRERAVDEFELKAGNHYVADGHNHATKHHSGGEQSKKQRKTSRRRLDASHSKRPQGHALESSMTRVSPDYKC